MVEGLLNSWRRVSDRPSWILIFKTPARKPTNVIIVVFFFIPRTRRTPRASSVVTRAGSGDTRAGSGGTRASKILKISIFHEKSFFFFDPGGHQGYLGSTQGYLGVKNR